MKVRLDQILIDRGIAPNPDIANTMIRAGEVCVDDQISDKPGRLYSSFIKVRIKEKCAYVSRGGLKLEKGLAHFHLVIKGMVCIDIGTSTGGFTDCLLQHHGKKVYAVDVAYGQLAWKIRQDPRVVVLERFNAKNITKENIEEQGVDLAVMDVSFTSLTTLLPPVIRLFSQDVAIVALIKPQFELPSKEVSKGGIVLASALHKKAIDKIETFVHRIGLVSRGIVPSPLLGPKGNREFLIYITS